MKPAWPWSRDQTELGTADFRSIKFNIYEASLAAPDGSGMRVDANADAHFRSCLAKDGVMMHILSQCPLAQVVLNNGDRIKGEFAVRLISKFQPVSSPRSKPPTRQVRSSNTHSRLG